MPWYTRYDYIEVHAWDSGSGDYIQLWRDDFDFLDTARWRVSDGWSFDHNSSTFTKDNVYTEDGALVLRMHKTASPPPAPPSGGNPPDIELTSYVYGRTCKSSFDQTNCKDCQDSCHISYPFGDPLKWQSAGKACRCLPKQRAP